jgi:O-glycosyl hydrolase
MTGGKASGGSAGVTPAAGGSVASSVALGGKPNVTAVGGASLVTPNPAVKYQKFEGWGTSLCWWANRIGGWSTDKLNQFVKLIVNPTTGLGYNIFRYNIGGGEDPSHSHMTEYRDMPGFQTTKGTWDWNADARQVAVLRQIVATGKDVILEAFSNSPPYWMTKSGCASGSSDGSNNLKDDSYNLFAEYLTDVVKHHRDELGITFRTLEPMNEPNANWWKSSGSQEGCHFGASSQQQIIKAVGAQLAKKGLTETQVSASDENSMDDAYSIMSGYDATTLGYVAQMNVHSYAGTRRAEVRTLATSKGKRLWQSESGPLNVTLNSNTEAALFMAGRIIADLRELKPEAWIDWQVYDTAANWTSFNINAMQESATPVKRFYMHAAFSHFIRPGATFVNIDDANMVAALAGDGTTLTVVVRNGETATSRNYTFDLTELPSVGSRVEVYRTSATEDLVHLTSIEIKNWSFTASSVPSSVTTYVIPLI